MSAGEEYRKPGKGAVSRMAELVVPAHTKVKSGRAKYQIQVGVTVPTQHPD